MQRHLHIRGWVLAKLMLRRVFAGEPIQGWHITIMSEAARYGWRPPVRDKQGQNSDVFAEDGNAAMDYLIRMLPDQYEMEVERG